MTDGSNLKELLESIRPAWLGTLGGAVGFLWASSRQERLLGAVLCVLYLVLGGAAAYTLDAAFHAWVDPASVLQAFRGIGMFFAGSLGLAAYEIGAARALEWLRQWKFPSRK